MQLSPVDYLLTRAAHSLQPLMAPLADVESRWAFAGKPAPVIERPVFITGLARAGTTVLLDLFSRYAEVATHRYRDFPFVCLPLAWNRLQTILGSSQAAVERPHRDRILITRDSPEAFEEPLWQFAFPHTHDDAVSHRLDGAVSNPEFERQFTAHLQKMLLLRGGTRYVSKGNYNVARIEYLARLFPDARFVVPVRDPLEHVHSLVRQHELFCAYAESDPRVAHYLRAAGHYEFGPQRQPIQIADEAVGRAQAAWATGDEYRGYACQWTDVYGHVQRLLAAGDELSQRLFVVPYEAFCAEPAAQFAALAEALGFAPANAAVNARLATISAPERRGEGVTTNARVAVSDETATVAAAFGYA